MSHCELTRLDFIAGFTQLTTLILDNNKLSATTRLPDLPLLDTLFMNANLITSNALGALLDHLALATPVRFHHSFFTSSFFFFFLRNERWVAIVSYAKWQRLRYLSLIHNEAHPFSTASHHNYNYRIYVLSKLPLLTKLDSSNITDEERKGAAAIREHR